MQLAVDSQREGGRISTFHGSPYSDRVITGFFNLTSSGFLAAHNVHTTYFPVFKQMLERLRFLLEWWDCAFTMLALRHPLTAALCQCGQSVLVKLVSMANEWNPKTAQTSKKGSALFLLSIDVQACSSHWWTYLLFIEQPEAWVVV